MWGVLGGAVGVGWCGETPPSVPPRARGGKLLPTLVQFFNDLSPFSVQGEGDLQRLYLVVNKAETSVMN